MGKGGQYERLLLAVVILAGQLGAFLLLGALALGVILAQILLLMWLAFAPVALVIASSPAAATTSSEAWLTKLAGYLRGRSSTALILAVVLAVCQALDDATSNLGWLLAFVLQAAFLWAVFLQRNRMAADLLSATAGSGPAPRTGRAACRASTTPPASRGWPGCTGKAQQQHPRGGAPQTQARPRPHPQPRRPP
jgi:uncharacterized RDD family membrane protein YckC